MKSQSTVGKDPDAGKDRGQEEKGVTEHERVRQHHQFSGYKSEQTLGESKEPGKPGVLQSIGSQRVMQLSN